MTGEPLTAEEAKARCARIRESHADAMTALGADVHPYTASAISAHEQEMDESLAALAVSHELLRARLEQAERKAEAYDAARATVKIEGNTRAYYVLRAEAAEARLEQAERERDEWQETAKAWKERWSSVTRDWNEDIAALVQARQALRDAEAELIDRSHLPGSNAEAAVAIIRQALAAAGEPGAGADET